MMSSVFVSRESEKNPEKRGKCMIFPENPIGYILPWFTLSRGHSLHIVELHRLRKPPRLLRSAVRSAHITSQDRLSRVVVFSQCRLVVEFMSGVRRFERGCDICEVVLAEPGCAKRDTQQVLRPSFANFKCESSALSTTKSKD